MWHDLLFVPLTNGIPWEYNTIKLCQHSKGDRNVSLPIIFLLYAVSAAALVFFSIKCANYVDLLDKKTSLSGAFIGGVILAAVTSLPELVTSISSIYVVDNPELIIGNVLGSNIFNLCIFGSLTAIAARSFAKAKVGRSHLVTIVCTVIATVLVALTMVLGKGESGFGRIPYVNINVVTLLILVVYFISLRFLSTDDSESEEEDTSPLTVKQIVFRFVMMALGLVAMSIVVTFFTDKLDKKLELGASLAGALFLGVATSLPELSSSIALVRHRNFNAMVGNVVGSNMFNFTILSIADIIAGVKPVYVNSTQTMQMIVFGILSTALVAVSILLQERFKKADPCKGGKLAMYIVLGIAVCVSYLITVFW